MGSLIRCIRWGVIAVSALVALAIVGGLAYRSLSQWRIAASTRIDSPHGIESLEAVELGGVRQWLYLRGQDRDAPVLLFVHGGPGSPEMPLARSFGLRLEEHFVVVHWDQRASGKSALETVPPESLTIERYVADAVELIELLRSRFDEQRVYLVGHSWGSLIGTLVARDRPELLHAYVGLGQVVDMRRNEEISHRFVLERARETGNHQAIEELEPLRPPYDHDLAELMVQRRWLDRFGGGIHEGSMAPFIVRGTLSPEYSLWELYSTLESMKGLLEQLWGQMADVDLIAQAPRLDVPVYFLTGRHDYNTPFELVEEYFEVLEAPHKEIVWFEHSAHSPNLEEPERYQAVLIDEILPATHPRQASTP